MNWEYIYLIAAIASLCVLLTGNLYLFVKSQQKYSGYYTTAIVVAVIHSILSLIAYFHVGQFYSVIGVRVSELIFITLVLRGTLKFADRPLPVFYIFISSILIVWNAVPPLYNLNPQIALLVTSVYIAIVLMHAGLVILIGSEKRGPMNWIAGGSFLLWAIMHSAGPLVSVVLPAYFAQKYISISMQIIIAVEMFILRSEVSEEPYCETLPGALMDNGISIGVATKENAAEDIWAIFKEANARMERNKLVQKNSARSTLISTMEKALWERSHETEEHCHRMKEMIAAMGEYSNFASHQRDCLILAATLHDIRKIAIPDAILNKPGSLNDLEWETMKQHCKEGYRLACLNPVLEPVAETILAHHERWDGKGYSNGLKGEDIPQDARILSVIDSYDVMTQGRPYRKGIPHEEAIKELYRCAGSQFDPAMVQIFTVVSEAFVKRTV
ncbi:MAG: HD domain-containing protein [Bacillota bacterium]|nr:HD domain-containing protein [Bacillota bacterium]